jgi:bifunctional UDP-N-acetylglucosamine pyrophosphorylase/glucosamine-1-phosphate N-acetyltransferase
LEARYPKGPRETRDRGSRPSYALSAGCPGHPPSILGPVEHPFTALILAAGQGTRMRSRTPKVLHDLCGRPLGLWPVHAAREAGAALTVVVDSPARPLAEVLPDGVELVVQPRSNGTGGAVVAAADAIEGAHPVVILSGDVPLLRAETIAELVAAHVRSGAAATLLTSVLEDPSGYGRVVRDAEGLVARVVETKTPGDATQEELAIAEVNAGVYVFESGPLLEVLPRLSAENAQGELYLPHALELLRASGARVGALEAEDPHVVLGVNDRAQLAAVRALCQAEINERHMRAGVGITDPPSTMIDVDVRIEPDATIEPWTRVLGATRVGEGAVVGPQATVIDSDVGARAQVRVAWVQGARVGAGAMVGPFAYLRPGAELEQEAKAGTFVEVKASRIGAGAKIPHLSYIGDADVGAGSNLGAATITANYDGRAKHRTTIGERVRTGVDTTLVAPVTVGDDAYTGAGSVVTDDVPPGALAVARARQRNLEGYAERRAPPGAGDPPRREGEAAPRA